MVGLMRMVAGSRGMWLVYKGLVGCMLSMLGKGFVFEFDGESLCLG
jgi:hypothetical protein